MPTGLAKAVIGLMITGFMVVAARIILLKWKSPHRPEISEWLKLMTEIVAFELMIGRVQTNSNKTSQVWLYFVSSIVTNSYKGCRTLINIMEKGCICITLNAYLYVKCNGSRVLRGFIWTAFKFFCFFVFLLVCVSPLKYKMSCNIYV